MADQGGTSSYCNRIRFEREDGRSASRTSERFMGDVRDTVCNRRELISSGGLIVGPGQHSCLENNAISATHLSRYHPLIVRTAVVSLVTCPAGGWVFVPSKWRGHRADWLKWHATVGKTARSDNFECHLDEVALVGCISVVKTAISSTDDDFEKAERRVDRLQTSRNHLYARALAEFVARHADDRVQAAMNAVVAEVRV